MDWQPKRFLKPPPEQAGLVPPKCPTLTCPKIPSQLCHLSPSPKSRKTRLGCLKLNKITCFQIICCGRGAELADSGELNRNHERRFVPVVAKLSLLVSGWHLDALRTSPNLPCSLTDPPFFSRFNSEEPSACFRKGQGTKPQIVYVHEQPWDVTRFSYSEPFLMQPEWAIKIEHLQKYGNTCSVACTTVSASLILQ